MDNEWDESAETQRLLEQARAGHPGAAGRLFARYRSCLHRQIEIRLDERLRRRVDASDVVQEAQLEAARRLDEYLAKRPVPLGLWLRRIAHDRLAEAWRRHVRAARRAATREVMLPDQSALELAHQLVAGVSSPSEHLARKERARLVREALAELPEVDREILLMRDYEQLSYADIGQVLEIRPVAARNRHARALLRLGRTLHQRGMTGSGT